jgi:cation:H+ antiporter
MLAVVLLLASAAVIYLSCEYFVNAVEWAGLQWGVSRNAVGTVLAAFGTALPECVVTFVAVVFGHTDAQKEIGIGAAIGGPLVLATLAYAVVGAVFLLSRKHADGSLLAKVRTAKLATDQSWFIWIFVAKVLLGLVAFAIKPTMAIIFVLAYALYISGEMRGEDDADETGDELDLQPLKLCPNKKRPPTSWVLAQTLGSLVVIFLSSRLFVAQLDTIAPWLGIPPQLVALLLSPIATELPEILNAVIWVRQGKISLALGNISGAMMIQATIPSALGLFFTPWMLSKPLIWAAVITLVSIGGLNACLRREALTARRLALFGLLYVVFAAGFVIMQKEPGIPAQACHSLCQVLAATPSLQD